MRLTTHRLTPRCPSRSHHPHVLLPSLLSTRQQFSRREWPHHSLHHIMTRSMPTRRTRNSVLSHQCSLHPKPPMHRAAIQAVPSVVFPPHFCTARILPPLPIHHPAPGWHHLWLHRVRHRIILSLHRRPPQLLHPPHLRPPPLLAPALPSLVLPLPFSSPNPSAARSRIATSRTSKPMGSSTT